MNDPVVTGSPFDAYVRAIKFKRGDVCLVSAPRDNGFDIVKRLRVPYPLEDEHGRFQVPIVLLPFGTTLENVDEEYMKKAGWVRVSDVKNALQRSTTYR